MTSQSVEEVNPARERLKRVFQFLKALHELRNPVQREVTEQPWLIWFHDLPDHPAIERGTGLVAVKDEEAEGEDDPVPQSSGGTAVVLRVRRPELSAAPAPPDELVPWLEAGWDRPENDKVGVLDSQIETQLGVGEQITFDSDPGRVRLLDEWVGLRDEWLHQERPARKAMYLFEKLYALQSTLERENERVELMLGDGLLLWARNDLPVHHPVLLQHLHLEFEPSVPEFRLVETEDVPELYTALFRSMSDVSAQAVSRLRDDLSLNLWHPLGGEETSQFLKRVVTELSPTRGRFVGEGDRSSGSEAGPRISRDPVVFLRLKTLGFGTAIESILEDLGQSGEVPHSLSSIVGIEPNGWAPAPAGEAVSRLDPNGEDEDILLSKEANADQLKIAWRLERYGSVLVQGPPGTGKTHTIANLLGHLLAQGKSVLVTAHTTKALRVLRDHVVEPLQPLCVSVLDGTSKQLESAVDEISSRLSESSEDDLERDATILHARRAEVLRSLREARHELLRARESEYDKIVVGGTEFAPAEAAQLVAAGATINSWIPSPVSIGASLPSSVGELADLYRTNVSVTDQDEEEVSLGLPNPAELMAPTAFSNLCAIRGDLRPEQLDYRSDLWTATAHASGETLNDLLGQAAHAAHVLGEQSDWRLAIVAAGYEGGPRRQAWEELIAEINAAYAAASRAYPLLLRFAPAVPRESLSGRLLPVLAELRQHLEKGGKVTTVQSILHRNWKVIAETARVNGEPPTLPEHIEALEALVELHEARAHLLERWNRQVTELGGPDGESLGAEPEQGCHQFVLSIEEALDWMSQVWVPLEQALRNQGLRWEVLLSEVPPDLAPFGNLRRLRVAVSEYLPGVIAAEVLRLDMGRVGDQLQELRTHLDRCGTGGQAQAPTVSDLREAVAALDPEAYEVSFKRLVDLYERQEFAHRRQQLLARLEAVAPSWAGAVRNRLGEHGGDTPPGDPQGAWIWRQLSDELDRRAAVSFEEIQSRVEQLRIQLLRLTALLIEKKTWAAQMKRTSLAQRTALTRWKQLIKKAGKQKGKAAPKFLAAAKQLMPTCQSAVPVWIMPLSQVVENFDPSRNRFDVVIIDEASQADVMALTALYMGRQVIVVGDPEQVTPEAVGQRLDEIRPLIDTFLHGIPGRDLYDGQTSVYDIVNGPFRGAVQLKEHFRCVPDIIQFSNRLSYGGSIQPLRDASQVRLRPYTVAYRVEGLSHDRKTNEIEARTVASLLIAATEQPEYERATFGVMSLVGAEQAARIDLLLQRFLSPAEYHRRRVQCGNPAQFQGDERDVVFLSMVYSRSEEGPLPRVADPGERVKKRYNVAASRARDQLWVVHSLDPEIDLQPGDIRRELILHVRDPRAADIETARLEPRTESEFERQVLQHLIRKGFNVTPQWRVGPFRIDMVVEDGPRRLAVECDGDRYHAGRLADDMMRQAILERLGWRFSRIRGSQFFRNPDQSMALVFERLNTLGIRPVRQEPDLSATVTEEDDLKLRVTRRAEELRREWDQLGNDLVVESHGRTRAPRFGGRRNGRAGGEGEKGGAAAGGSEQPAAPPELRSQAVMAPQPMADSRGPARRQQGTRSTADQTRLPLVPETERGKKPATHPPAAAQPEAHPEARQVNGEFNIIEFLRLQHLEVIDKRAAGGALWVVGGAEISALLSSLKDKGFRFSFAKNGGKATKNCPAWFTK